MGNIVNKLCSSESGNTDEEHTDMKERAELSDTPGRDEVTEYNDNEIPRNENAKEGDTEDLGMQLWTSNYIIVREIMSHLDWREQLPCELVCRLWRDAVKSVRRTRSLRSYDFVMVRDKMEYCYMHKFHVSDLPVHTRPMCAIGFYNTSTVKDSVPCERFSPAPCDPPCATEHTIIEAVHEIMLSKRTSLLAVCGNLLIYKPLLSSRTFQYTVYNMGQHSAPFMVGLYLPKIPNVNYRTVQYRSEDTEQEDFYSVVDDIYATDIIKGVVVFAEQKQNFQELKYENLGFLNYIKNKQPSILYALGGCVMWEVVCEGIIIEEDVTVTMAVFSVPKEPEPEPGPPCQFNMHSLIIDSTVQEEAAIQEAIQTFAGSIPELQYSAALMMSHLKLYDSDIDIEQELFRASFPRTTLVGCYSDAVTGCNHPDTRPQPTEATRRLSDGEPEIVHPDSTVFVYFSWGKQRTSGGEEAHHTRRELAQQSDGKKLRKLTKPKAF